MPTLELSKKLKIIMMTFIKLHLTITLLIVICFVTSLRSAASRQDKTEQSGLILYSLFDLPSGSWVTKAGYITS